MPWIAMKQQKIQRDGEHILVKPGDEIPEAEFWPNREAWVRQKFIKFVERTTKAKKVDVKIKEPKVEETKVEETKVEEAKVEETEVEETEVEETSAPKAKTKKKAKKKKR